MPGARFKPVPAPASEPWDSASDEQSQLDLLLQRQLEDDVARIFDESIYSDLEVACGKLKILTHSCILKARTNTFYYKLESILHVNIERNDFEEIYSFISDAYTECDIKQQEKGIITYLNDNLSKTRNKNSVIESKVDTDVFDVFLTPKCTSPYADKSKQKILSESPSTEITKEYYELVPIESHLLDKELIEQDVLSDAFQSIIKSQVGDLEEERNTHRNKPTSLSLSSSHTSKPVKHSNNCDILNKFHLKEDSKDISIIISSRNCNADQSEAFKDTKKLAQNICEDRFPEYAFSPDSLIADDLSSSSDYLSAAYTCSPGVSFSGVSQLNVVSKNTIIENTITMSDSGLDNTGLLESLDSHKDVTLTDVSLTESTLHDFTADEINEPIPGSIAGHSQAHKPKPAVPLASDCSTYSETELSGQILSYLPIVNESRKSSKEEKQRQNEDIVILESSSVSSETGSWESVFPPKLAEKDICQKFINNERQHSEEKQSRDVNNHTAKEEISSSLVQKSPFKTTSCFIDAASLVDEDDTMKIKTVVKSIQKYEKSHMHPIPSRPIPCISDISPNDCSESNEDSLEQSDNKDPDSIQKDLSPTIFDMTPITEDSLTTNAFEHAANAEEKSKITKHTKVVEKTGARSTSTIIVSNTPHNSIMSVQSSSLKTYESEESETDTTIIGRESHNNIIKLKKFNESSPIVSGGASIEDHLPQISSYVGSPLTRRKIENIPIVSGAYLPVMEETSHRRSPKSTSTSAWVVDMSTIRNTDHEENLTNVNTIKQKPEDRLVDKLKNDSHNSGLDNINKSRSSVDSDSSDRSSQKFYIDLTSLPDSISPTNKEIVKSNEKKNIFSMFIDLGEKSTVKDMPARLSSFLNQKKNANTDIKTIPKLLKVGKSLNEYSIATVLRPDHDHNTFEKYESLCNDPNISIAEIINLPSQNSTKTDDVEPDVVQDKSQKNDEERMVSIISKEHKSERTADLFVKLSDLDKPTPRPDTLLQINEDIITDIRMTRSIPESSWRDKNNSGTSRSSIDVMSSFHSENALSLNRLFPHLKNEFSKSMPGALPGRTRSPFKMGCTSPSDEQAFDTSELSSMQSSVCRSVVENSTTEETSQMSSLIDNCQSRLGQDLLRMFLEEIAPDVIVDVSGRRIKAHKCILSSRCQYFAGILSGGWVESAGNIIVLPPFPFNVVHFALCHIYSGVSTIPDTVNIVQLASIADVLGLEGLKEAIMFTLKAKYCHHFHRPCAVCIAGVLECFPLSSLCGLDDLYLKCLRWITKYFPKVWPTKAFAILPKELSDKCYQQIVVNLTVENLSDTVYGCGITVGSLPESRWAECVTRMCRRLVNAAAHFAAARLSSVLRAAVVAATAAAPPPPTHARQALHDCLAAAIEWAPPEEACRAYAYLSALLKELRTHTCSKPDLITNGNQNKVANQNHLYGHVGAWRLQCEGALVRAAPRVVTTQAFKDLPADLRKRLRELGCIMFGPQALPVTASASPVQERKCQRNQNKNKGASNSTNNLDIDHVRASFVPYAPKPASSVTGSVDNFRSKNGLRDKTGSRTVPPKIRTTKAQEERAKFNLIKNNQTQDRIVNKVNAMRPLFENTKPRYLEPRVSKEVERRVSDSKKLAVPKMLSSSESSRNSSPIQARRFRSSRPLNRQSAGVGMAGVVQVSSQDSLATSYRPKTADPSTDSFSESQNSNKYATYTKTKHSSKGSIESIILPANVKPIDKNKIKTKIPVYQNQTCKSNNTEKKEHDTKKPSDSKPRARGNDRKLGSLMSATKSSSAKVVPKTVKESGQTSRGKRTGHKSRQHAQAPQRPPDISVMERSGTFLKDEPTFGDKTTIIDIDQNFCREPEA